MFFFLRLLIIDKFIKKNAIIKEVIIMDKKLKLIEELNHYINTKEQ